MMRICNLLGFVLILLLAVCCNSKQATKSEIDLDQYFDTSWAQKKTWDDGKAEVTKYTATRNVYGKTREFEYTYIVVKEVFNEEYNVKTDDYRRSDLFPVMKVNKFCSFETKAYPYHYLTSLFFKQEKPQQLYKLTNTSQEWCGNTAKSFLNKKDHYLFEYMSYWDGQGNGSMKVSNQALFEDQLSYTLRSLKFEDGLQFNTEIYSSQVSSKVSAPLAIKSSFSVSKEIENDASALWKVMVEKENQQRLTFWFEPNYPNTLIKMEAYGDRSLSIDTTYRDAYWSRE